MCTNSCINNRRPATVCGAYLSGAKNRSDPTATASAPTIPVRTAACSSAWIRIHEKSNPNRACNSRANPTSNGCPGESRISGTVGAAAVNRLAGDHDRAGRCAIPVCFAATCGAAATPPIPPPPQRRQPRPVFAASQHLSMRGHAHVGCTPPQRTVGYHHPFRSKTAGPRRGRGHRAALM